MRKYARSVEERAPERTGRPPALRQADEWELYCYRKSGVAIKACASMFRVSVPTANRIIAKFKAYDERVEPLARDFREGLEGLKGTAASFAPNRGLSLDCEKALSLMEQAMALLDGVVKRGEVELGSPPDMARGYLEDAIGMITPLEEDTEVAHG